MWQWSTGVQVASALLIAVFFLALRRTGDAPGLRWWTRAWLANLAALGVTSVFWLLQPPGIAYPILRALYMGSKSAFVLLLVQGALWRHADRRGGRLGGRLVEPRLVLPAAVVWGLGGAFVFTTVPLMGAAQHALLALVLGVGGAAVLRTRVRRPGRGLGWLAAGMLLRAALAVPETAAYVVRQLHPELATGLDRPLGVFLAAHSSFDTGAEWALALGCVLALAGQAQAELRRLADRDALTGLTTRRLLPQLLRDAAPDGATLLFLDLDDFKQVNDRLGHLAGDERLVRFGAALREAFPAPHDVVRYAGDEFVVIARALAPAALDDRLARLRGANIPFSAGSAPLPPHGDPDAALRAADDAMYRVKAGRRPEPVDELLAASPA